MSARDLAVLFALAFALYALSFANGFAFDDYINVVNNLQIRSLENAWASFQQPGFPGDLYRPVTVLSNAILYAAFGTWALPYHVLNASLHALNAVLIGLLLARRFRAAAPFLGALLFAVLPIHVEAVANVTGRAELLCASFGLSALLLSTATNPRHFVAGVLFLAAMLSKESGVVWPLFALVMSRRVTLRAILPIATAYLIFAALRWNALYSDTLYSNAAPSTIIYDLDNPLVALPAWSRVVWALALLGRYALISFAPIGIGSDYSFGYFDVTSLTPALLYLPALLALLAVAALAPRTRLGILWFFVAFTITSNVFFPIGTIFGERLAYTPCIGLVAAISCVVVTPLARKLCFLLTIVYAALTLSLIPIWKSNDALFTHQIAVSPASVKTVANYGIALRNDGRLEEADLALRSALARYPKYATAAFGIGTVYVAKKMPEGAIHWFHKTLELDPYHVEALVSLGRTYLAVGNVERARRSFVQVISIDPLNLRARNGLLAVAIETGDEDEARAIIQVIEKISPEDSEFKLLMASFDERFARKS